MAPATDEPAHEAVIVAHGSPSDPVSQNEAMTALAERVAELSPGLFVRGATLAGKGSLDRALNGMRHPLIYPFFMAEGYFTAGVLPERISGISRHAKILPAFGSDPAVHSIISDAAMEGAVVHGLAPEVTTLVLAAHGSQVSPASRERTVDCQRRLAATTPFRHIVIGFIEEEPFLHDVAGVSGGALCLPLFTLQAGHVTSDVPHALKRAGFEGVLLAHIGAHPDVPALIATSLVRHHRKAAA